MIRRGFFASFAAALAGLIPGRSRAEDQPAKMQYRLVWVHPNDVRQPISADGPVITSRAAAIDALNRLEKSITPDWAVELQETPVIRWHTIARRRGTWQTPGQDQPEV